MERSSAIGRHLSVIEGHYKLVEHVLIEEAKSTIKNKRKIIKGKGNLTRRGQQQWHVRKFWGLMK